MLYTAQHKMADLICQEPRVLTLISRFGLPFGVGDKTIEQVCEEQQLDTTTFLMVINYQLSHQPVDVHKIDITALQTYIHNAHNYYLQYRLPYLRRTLLEAMPSVDDHQVVMLILRYFDAFVQLLRRHMHEEDAGIRKTHEQDDQHIVRKLSELVGLIVKYYPSDHSQEFSPMIVNALDQLYRTEEDILRHCDIEDHILIPAMEAQQHADQADNHETLSERETDVLVEIVNGYSNKQIADHLCLSIHTVISHRKNIVRKLGIHSAAGLTIYAVVNNLVQLDQLKNKIKGL